ncbi:MFS transporter [Zavarzinia compransoris]|uniref:MFS transporter n=1 Tax=Zavarzinia compransoris TaxID=1264899 RepID=A0A317E1I6_9PROT|nr:MFS transporter [Zavarzinia compransoris]PWR19986.1 MFS transporter [Zavarzinia compransoris]TDP44899.1 RhtX/FptX family siderophore transporter [Zavarzinia compransoris]
MSRPPAAPGLGLIGALYVTQGIPLGFAFEALPVLLRAGGADLDLIALVPLAGMPWIVKLFWAPLVENRWIGALGRRRTWIVTMQGLMVLCMAALAALPMTAAAAPAIIALVLVAALAGATQDTATDGLAAESLRGSRLALANAFQIGGMMAGFMAGGAGFLILADGIGTAGGLLVLALALAAALVPVLLWSEGAPAAAAPARLAAGLRRPGVLRLLALAAVYATLQTAGGGVSRLLLVDHGWSMAAIGALSLVGGLAMIAASPVAARLLTVFSPRGVIVAGLLLAGLGLGLWLPVAQGWGGTWLPHAAIVVLSAGAGLAAVAVSTLFMGFAGRGGQAGTDFTLLQSAQVLGETAAGSLAVALAGALGYRDGLLVLLAWALVVVAIARRATAKGKH